RRVLGMFLVACLLPCLLVSCTALREPPPALPAPLLPPEPPLYEWHGDDGITGKPSIRINLTEQKARYYRGGKEVAWTYVTTGRAGYRTPAGTFRITEKTADKYSNRYGVIRDADGEILVPVARVGREKVPAGAEFEGF